MKKHFLTLGLIFSAAAIGVFAQPKNVADFYLAMPNDAFSTNIEGKKNYE